MGAEFDVFLPGDKCPVTLDKFASYVASVAACGTYEQSFLVPDHFVYDNPKTDNNYSIE